MLDLIDEIIEHPFNVIGLGDREKFHTGMLSYLINQLSPEASMKLISVMWNRPMPTHLPSRIVAEVEVKSTDLVISCDGAVTYVAEMKLKSLLHGNQQLDFARNFPAAQATILGLFEKAPYVSFPRLLTENFADRGAIEGIEDDAQRLIRLWLNYLEMLSNLTQQFEDLGLKSLPDADRVRDRLRVAKLEGIFEAWRHWLVQEKLADLPAGMRVSESNTHGRHLTDWGRKFRGVELGIQWQTDSAKLFASVPNDASDDMRCTRDKLLEDALTVYCSEFNERTGFSLSNGKWFRSATVGKIDCFRDLGVAVAELRPRIEFVNRYCDQQH
ncbi:hypothetical protein [Henriciella mobilis]|uniref:PD-(D/E)XK nuclease superfamily protein n=1 Tax=Henriciella mobilis TaxID=2305467 RepID=A0A399RDX1_9PROT|nr:hypothetical protein [Henriciella mobilis]RIJ29786.1 hypothetical protein D1223_09265 [Henriciella mobilis]